jgi:hypothetical protein
MGRRAGMSAVEVMAVMRPVEVSTVWMSPRRRMGCGQPAATLMWFCQRWCSAEPARRATAT